MTSSRILFFMLLAVSPLALRADPATDRKIEDAAKASYNFRAVFQNQLTVKADDGVVTLSGTVLDRDQKALAEDSVRNLPGVVDVKNELEVASPGPERADGWIALKIRSVLLMRKNVSAAHTDVRVHDGVVILTGTADDAAQKELTGEYARGVEGVRSVRNEMKIRGMDGRDNAAGNERTMSDKLDDRAITSHVMYALFANQAPSALSTRVDTRAGVVVIRGQAASVVEKERITQLARQVRGVDSVANEMSIAAAE